MLWRLINISMDTCKEPTKASDPYSSYYSKDQSTLTQLLLHWSYLEMKYRADRQMAIGSSINLISWFHSTEGRLSASLLFPYKPHLFLDQHDKINSRLCVARTNNRSCWMPAKFFCADCHQTPFENTLTNSFFF